jgi:hypothetical protein
MGFAPGHQLGVGGLLQPGQGSSGLFLKEIDHGQQAGARRCLLVGLGQFPEPADLGQHLLVSLRPLAQAGGHGRPLGRHVAPGVALELAQTVAKGRRPRRVYLGRLLQPLNKVGDDPRPPFVFHVEAAICGRNQGWDAGALLDQVVLGADGEERPGNGTVEHFQGSGPTVGLNLPDGAPQFRLGGQ